jgi:hypothetical protein
MMRHRDIEYSLVQGLGRHLWKWSATVADVVITGQAATKSEAVAEAERAIDRALAPKKVRLGRNGYDLARLAFTRWYVSARVLRWGLSFVLEASRRVACNVYAAAGD